MNYVIKNIETGDQKYIRGGDTIPKGWKLLLVCADTLVDAPVKETIGIDPYINPSGRSDAYNMDPSTGGIKEDKDKNRLELIHPVFLERLGVVMTHGAQKYADWNWYKGMSWARVYGSLNRHMVAWYGGEEIDPDSGLPHLSCAAACVMMLNVFEEKKLGEDDRP